MTYAEFHDLGKLLDWKAIGIQAFDDKGREYEPHDFEKCLDSNWGIDFNAEPWQAILRKEVDIRKQFWPSSLDWAYVSLADELAAGLGRALKEGTVIGERRNGRYCLWTGRQEMDPRLASKSDLEDLIKFLNTSPKWEDVVQRYGNILQRRAETARPGLNITSLYAHSVLCGKISRILRKLQVTFQSSQLSWEEVKNLFSRIKLTILHIRVLFPQRPFRTKDLNIFEERSKIIDWFIQKYPDNVLCAFNEEMLCLFPDEESTKMFISIFITNGFYLEYRRADKPIADLLAHGIQEVLGKVWMREYPNLPKEIIPPLCEGCQMAHAEKRWPTDVLLERRDLSETGRLVEYFPLQDQTILNEFLMERVEENLCVRCFELRRAGTRLKHLGDWQACQVAWLRLFLDMGQLIDTLVNLQKLYIKSAANSFLQDKLDQLEVRMPLIVDFLDEYNVYLHKFEAELRQIVTENNIECVSEGLWCIRLEKRSKIIDILNAYNILFKKSFPRFCSSSSLSSPILLGISISHVKYPFFLHWRFIEKPIDEIAIQVVNSGTATIKMSILESVLTVLGQRQRNTLHRLRQIAHTSHVIAELVLHDKWDRDSKDFERLRAILPLGLDFESLLTMTNLAED